jgi:hypothetical protein
VFEQAVLHPPPARGWLVSLAIAGAALLSSCARVTPRFWPQLLPKAQTLTSNFVLGPQAETEQTPVPYARRLRPGRQGDATLDPACAIRRTVASLDEPPSRAWVWRKVPPCRKRASRM